MDRAGTDKNEVYVTHGERRPAVDRHFSARENPETGVLLDKKDVERKPKKEFPAVRSGRLLGSGGQCTVCRESILLKETNKCARTALLISRATL